MELVDRNAAGALALARFARSVPKRPYAADVLPGPIMRVPRSEAIRARYPQPNPDAFINFLTFDLDHNAAASAERDGILPLANIAVLNQDNGCGHLSFRLATPVARTDAARSAPLRFLANVERGMICRLDADHGFAGLLTKNPLHGSYRVIARHDHGFTLAELADSLHCANMRRRKPESSGLGRNVVVFDELRSIA